MSKSFNYYAKAIEILENGLSDSNCRSMCWALARKNPRLFVDISNEFLFVNLNEVDRVVLAVAREKGKIAAVRQYRELTSTALGEAKHYVEKLAEDNGLVFGNSNP